MDSSHKRHILKTLTWRVVGTVDTMVLSWIISVDPMVGLKIGAAEVVTKMLLYYFHERVWFKLNISKDGLNLNSTKRHILKTISYRFFGTLDTMLLAWIISGNPITGLQIGVAEVLTKMLLYYLHERVWYKIHFGLSNRESDNNATLS